jgi:hypothetical protein
VIDLIQHYDKKEGKANFANLGLNSIYSSLVNQLLRPFLKKIVSLILKTKNKETPRFFNSFMKLH